MENSRAGAVQPAALEKGGGVMERRQGGRTLLSEWGQTNIREKLHSPEWGGLPNSERGGDGICNRARDAKEGLYKRPPLT